MPIPQHPDSWMIDRPAWPLSASLRQDREPSSLKSGLEVNIGTQTQETLRGLRDNNGSIPEPGQESVLCTDRTELMERIKRGESPTWVPSETLQREFMKEDDCRLKMSPQPVAEAPSEILHSAHLEPQNVQETLPDASELASEIERPPSALHAGDFNENSRRSHTIPKYGEALHRLQSSASLLHDGQWQTDRSLLGPFEAVAPWTCEGSSKVGSSKQKSAWHPVSTSSYIFRKPTTPLIQQSNHADLDFTARDRSASPEKAHRRHTLPPQALHSWQTSANPSEPSLSPSSFIPKVYRREPFTPQLHHARRSITSTWSIQQPSSPPTPGFLRSRRTSSTSEASPRQKASMVGSYEESILHGRMSTAPSKPFDFHAYIGALGRGKIPQMPRHITVPFQAVFYDWSSDPRRITVYDEPSPYVGNIELQKAIKASAPLDASGNEREAIPMAQPKEQYSVQSGVESVPDSPTNQPERQKRRHMLPLPNGGYRIPERGQIQVVVKNSYKTALKLFLVPYDVADMVTGQKTFVRQRYYSAGPIIERPVVTGGKTPFSLTDRRKSTLRYLIHLKICCPGKGRYYLYNNVRVVFANRVPDDREHLTKELQEPNPKYSPWRPDSESFLSSTPTYKQTWNSSTRRRSLGASYGPSNRDMHRSHSYTGTSFPDADADIPPVPSIPFNLPPPIHSDVGPSIRSNQDVEMLDLPLAVQSSPRHAVESDANSESFPTAAIHVTDSQNYTKLEKGDDGYGGSFSRAGTPKPGEGLLAMRLKSLDVQKNFGIESQYNAQ